MKTTLLFWKRTLGVLPLTFLKYLLITFHYWRPEWGVRLSLGVMARYQKRRHLFSPDETVLMCASDDDLPCLDHVDVRNVKIKKTLSLILASRCLLWLANSVMVPSVFVWLLLKSVGWFIVGLGDIAETFIMIECFVSVNIDNYWSFLMIYFS